MSEETQNEVTEVAEVVSEVAVEITPEEVSQPEIVAKQEV